MVFVLNKLRRFLLRELERATLPLKAVHEPFLRKCCLYGLQLMRGIGILSLCMLGAPFLLFWMFLQREKKETTIAIEQFASSFPEGFKVGFSDSFFQSCGLGLNAKMKQGSDWNEWVVGHHKNGKPYIEGAPDLAQFFINYLEDPQIVIQKLKELGATTYRFSLERAVIEPQEGIFDESYLEFYHRFIEQLKEAGIQPIVTLHHFVNPAWFLEKGGFEKKENIPGFVRYCEKMFRAFADVVTHWVTINEPAVYAFQAYCHGVYPPGKKNLSVAAIVMQNLLISHCEIYKTGKAINPSFQIGISHNWLSFQPYTLYNPVEKLICHYLTELTHRAVIRFLQTGNFSLQIPFLVNRCYEEKSAPYCFDFIGVQYYSKPLLKIGFFSAQSMAYPGGTMTGLGGRFYPQGLEEVLEEASTLGRPIWITETGCDVQHADYFEVVFSIVSRAIARGIPLVGALIWTLRDNLEWDRGEQVKMGMYTVNFEKKSAVDAVIKPIFHQISGAMRSVNKQKGRVPRASRTSSHV